MLLPGLKCSLCYGGEKQQLSPSVSQPVTGTWLRKRLMGRKSPVQKNLPLGWRQGSAQRINKQFGRAELTCAAGRKVLLINII